MDPAPESYGNSLVHTYPNTLGNNSQLKKKRSGVSILLAGDHGNDHV